ncbi:hypothetical protein EVAR_47024_1 [Eumeta japonica]|uniref:Uncharacterized protein n=1 Tax=Eumeta variegata TaxID=151549 RepID=A0A4C1XJY6_EUMVA|nr:hypothetical protein EVAR_47024_1 [Eumeta japonica]
MSKYLLYADEQVILALLVSGVHETVNKMNDSVKKRVMKVIVSNTKGIIHYELLPPRKTNNSDLYCQQLIKLMQEVEKKAGIDQQKRFAQVNVFLTQALIRSSIISFSSNNEGIRYEETRTAEEFRQNTAPESSRHHCLVVTSISALRYRLLFTS